MLENRPIFHRLLALASGFWLLGSVFIIYYRLWLPLNLFKGSGNLFLQALYNKKTQLDSRLRLFTTDYNLDLRSYGQLLSLFAFVLIFTYHENAKLRKLLFISFKILMLESLSIIRRENIDPHCKRTS